jgi:hypothetical protein
LADVLRPIIVDQEKRAAAMKQSFQFWQEYYSPRAFVRWFEQVRSGTAPTFQPLANHKALLLRFAQNRWQRYVIQAFYTRPANAA